MRRLLLDRRLVARADGVTLELAQGTPHPANPLPLDGKTLWTRLNLALCFDRAPDGGLSGWAFENILGRDDDAIFVPVHSDDGLQWHRMDQAIIPGRARTIMRDDRDSDTSRRFKLVGQELWAPEEAGSERQIDVVEAHTRMRAGEPIIRRMVSMTSPDGASWSAPRLIAEEDPDHPHPWWTPGEPGWSGGDCFPCVLWSPECDAYVAFFRTNIYNGEGERRERAVGRAESRDFQTWSEHRLALHADMPGQRAQGYPAHDFYQFQVWPCSGVYLAVVSVFYWEQDLVRSELAWSPDTVHWERVAPGTDLIPQSEFGANDGGCRFAAMRPIEIGDEVWMYYGSDGGRHADTDRWSSLCLATFRRDRFAGLAARDGASGVIETHPVALDQDGLTLNADATNGEVRAELLLSDGSIVPGFEQAQCTPLRADALDHPVRWSRGATAPVDIKGEVRVRLYVRDATVYAVEIGSQRDLDRRDFTQETAL